MLKPYSLIWKHRKVLYAVTKSDIAGRFAGSALGLFWLLLYPVIFLGTYAFIYIFVFKVQVPSMDTYGYVLLIFCGLIPFIGFSEAIGSGTGSVISNANLIKNTLFPIELIPVRVVLSAQCTQLVGMAALLLILFFRGKLGYAILYVPAIWFLQIIFTIGLVWLLSSINVFFRDISNIVPVVILMLMMISPIAYTEEMIPAGLKIVLYFNPLYYMIMLYQKALIYNGLAPWNQILVFFAISVTIFSAGYFVFARLKAVFSDYV